MKRYLSLLLCLVFLFCFSSCRDDEPQRVITPDMLEITSEEENYAGALTRYRDVMSAVNCKVTVLEREHNNTIMHGNPDSYFLDEDYILIPFAPFNLQRLDMTEKLNDGLTEESASTVFSEFSNSASVIYNGEKDSYEIKFVTENLSEIFNADYDRKTDSFRYIYKKDTVSDTETVEFLEFADLSDNSYAVQSNKSRMFVTFDDKGNIERMYCSVLKDKHYTEKDSIYGATSVGISQRNWVINGKHDKYECIYEFEDGILTHKDSSGTAPVEVQIIASNYSSAFYMNQ